MKSADTRCDDGRGSLALRVRLRFPIRLSDRFLRRGERELDEAIHLFLIFRWHELIRIKTVFFIDRRNKSSNLARDIFCNALRNTPNSRPAFNKPGPNVRDAAA